MFNLNQVSERTVDTEKRINEQRSNYLREAAEKEAAEKAAREKMINESAMHSARLAYASSLERSKNRVRAIEEEISYTNTAATIVITEMVSNIVENALLLDEEEYSKLNPNYKSDIRETVRSILENSKIETVTNQDMLAIMEYASKILPDAKTGKYLTEDEISLLAARDKPQDIENAIKRLSGNVANRVATLVEKEQKKVSAIQQDLERVAPAKEEAPAEEVEGEEGFENVPTEEVPAEEAEAQEAPVEEVPAEGQEMPTEAGAEPSKHIHINPDGTTSIVTPSSQLDVNPDGSMDITLAEDVLVREVPRCGLLESLAVNEAANMIKEGKEYNGDLCLANAVLYMTITEALGETSLISVNENTYADIIVNAGGSLNEGLIKFFKEKNKERKLKKIIDLRAKAEKLKVSGKLASAEKLLAKADAMEAEIDLKDKKEEIKNTKTLKESCTVQWVPTQNKKDITDLAERIRAKRLLQEAEASQKIDLNWDFSSQPELLSEGKVKTFFCKISS